MSPKNSDPTAMIAEEVHRWRRAPVYFVRAVLGVRELWDKQIEILEAIRDYPLVVVAACHDSSKTFTAACAGLWFAFSFCPSKVITTGDDRFSRRGMAERPRAALQTGKRALSNPPPEAPRRTATSAGSPELRAQTSPAAECRRRVSRRLGAA